MTDWLRVEPSTVSKGGLRVTMVDADGESVSREVTGDEFRAVVAEAVWNANTLAEPKPVERRMHRYAARLDVERQRVQVWEEVDGRPATTPRPTGLQSICDASNRLSLGDVWRAAAHHFTFAELALTRADGTIETRPG